MPSRGKRMNGEPVNGDRIAGISHEIPHRKSASCDCLPLCLRTPMINHDSPNEMVTDWSGSFHVNGPLGAAEWCPNFVMPCHVSVE